MRTLYILLCISLSIQIINKNKDSLLVVIWIASSFQLRTFLMIRLLDKPSVIFFPQNAPVRLINLYFWKDHLQAFDEHQRMRSRTLFSNSEASWWIGHAIILGFLFSVFSIFLSLVIFCFKHQVFIKSFPWTFIPCDISCKVPVII